MKVRSLDSSCALVSPGGQPGLTSQRLWGFGLTEALFPPTKNTPSLPAPPPTVSQLHVTASERFLPGAAFLPVTTPVWGLQACLFCINTLNFYGACGALA